MANILAYQEYIEVLKMTDDIDKKIENLKDIKEDIYLQHGVSSQTMRHYVNRFSEERFTAAELKYLREVNKTCKYTEKDCVLNI
tara:strand:- start:53 stop:304 length:252 start_codon:yes stop_codon:yes gene_type:complete